MLDNAKLQILALSLAAVLLVQPKPTQAGMGGVVEKAPPTTKRDQRAPSTKQKVEQEREKRLKELFEIIYSPDSSDVQFEDAAEKIDKIAAEIQKEAMEAMLRLTLDPILLGNKLGQCNQQAADWRRRIEENLNKRRQREKALEPEPPNPCGKPAADENLKRGPAIR